MRDVYMCSVCLKYFKVGLSGQVDVNISCCRLCSPNDARFAKDWLFLIMSYPRRLQSFYFYFFKALEKENFSFPISLINLFGF
jgi:hypothetical protein